MGLRGRPESWMVAFLGLDGFFVGVALSGLGIWGVAGVSSWVEWVNW